VTTTRSSTDVEQSAARGTRAARPGLVIVFSAGRATLFPLPLAGGELVIGREAPDARLDDARASRLHARVSFENGAWTFTDLSSRNGTFVDGRRIEEHRTRSPRVLRIGDTLLTPSDDVYAHDAERLRHADRPVVGAHLAHAWSLIEQAARTSRTLHIVGETGTGKELAARHYHASSPRSGPFVAVNCAAIPPHLAERVLFGARRGAYTGANEAAAGLIAEAEGGTLFLDEIGELDLAVQAKLLRAVESGEILALGATRAQHVDVRFCSATHLDLDRAVSEGRFRADLRYRLATPCVRLPPLRERTDEIAWHVQRELGAIGSELAAHVTLVEACLVRDWPGNVRQLAAELREASTRALARDSQHLRASDLPQALAAPIDARTDDDRIERALAEHGGNVSGAARALGLHRNQLRRWLRAREE
jgi:DNA-binding NtrC family response regulator